MFHTRCHCTLELFTSRKVYGTREIYDYRHKELGGSKKECEEKDLQKKEFERANEQLMSVLFMVPRIFLKF